MTALTIKRLPISQIAPDPNQPRRTLGSEALADLAASIKERGLLQPIGVRKNPAGTPAWLVVFGERRFRAHLINGAKTIVARVFDVSENDLRISQLIENMQRENVNSIEEADAYRAVMDSTGWSVAEMARRLGLKHPVAVADRLSLLKLKPEYQDMVRRGHLTQSQGFEMSRVPVEHQGRLFHGLRTGKAATQAALRSAANAILEQVGQSSLFGPEETPAAPDEATVRAARSLEEKIAKVCEILAAGVRDNEIVAVKKINPANAIATAERLALIQKDLSRIERALRAVAVMQADLLAA